MRHKKSADAANIGAHNWKTKLRKYVTRARARLQTPHDRRENDRTTSAKEYQTERSTRKVDSRLPVNRNHGNPQNRAPEFVFTQLDALLKEPEEQMAYVWDRTLPYGGFSICAAKPKVGKSTFARNLAVAITRGADFCGRQTAKGKVIYLCLEEKRAEVAAHFRRMGAADSDIYIHTGRTPDDVHSALARAIADMKPILVIIDPLSRFVRVKEFNSYGEVTHALEPLIDLARETNTHILALHHTGKGDRELGDGVLGSTAFFGAVDTMLEMKRSNDLRTIASRQRYGEDMVASVVHLAPDTGIITLAGHLQALQLKEHETKVLDALRHGNKTEPDIKRCVGGNQTLTAKAIRSLHDSGVLERSGTGKKGDPYCYTISTSSGSDKADCWIIDI